MLDSENVVEGAIRDFGKDVVLGKIVVEDKQ
jgi:hypothetical protein